MPSAGGLAGQFAGRRDKGSGEVQHPAGLETELRGIRASQGLTEQRQSKARLLRVHIGARALRSLLRSPNRAFSPL